MGSEIAARNRKSLATFHRTLKSQCSIAFSCLGNRAISGVRDGHRNRKSQNRCDFGALSCLLRAKSFSVLTKDQIGHTTKDTIVVRCTGRGLVVKCPGILSKVLWLDPVLGVIVSASTTPDPMLLQRYLDKWEACHATNW